jgi:cytochrome b pre-mRNA-processing protein 3
LAGILSLFRRDRHERAGFQLYTTTVGSARDPFLYTDLGVPDTLDGRFDMIGLHAFLLIRRLSRDTEPGPALAQAVFDAMFSDMDINLRELGVGDLSVGRKVKEMWEAFHGRSRAYSAALDAGDDAAFETALARNVWRGGEPPASGPAGLVRLSHAQLGHLGTQALPKLAAGTVSFLPAMEAAR